MLKIDKYVLRTTEEQITLLAFNAQNEVIARYWFKTRMEARQYLRETTGQEITFTPMQTEGAERVVLRDVSIEFAEQEG